MNSILHWSCRIIKTALSTVSGRGISDKHPTALSSRAGLMYCFLVDQTLDSKVLVRAPKKTVSAVWAVTSCQQPDFLQHLFYWGPFHFPFFRYIDHARRHEELALN